MADIKEVLDWADSLCKHALTEARNGNTAVVNRLGANTAMKIYFDNVHGTGVIKSHDFPFQYASRFKEISGLYEDYQRELATVEAVDKVATLESKLDNLAAMVQQLVEAQQKPAEITIETKIEGNADAIIKEVERLNKKKPAKTEVVETEVVAEEVEAETPAEEVESEE
jgi:hypothetical protein